MVPLILHVEFTVGDENANRAFVGIESLIDVETVPGAGILVFGNALDELPRRTNCVHVHLVQVPVTDIAEAQGERSADDRVHLVVSTRSER